MTRLGRLMPASAIVGIDLFRPASPEGVTKGGLPERVYSTVATDAEAAISELTGDQKVRGYGEDSEVTVQVLVNNSLGIAVADLIEVKTGFFVGQFFDVDDVKPGVGLIQIAGAKDTKRRP